MISSLFFCEALDSGHLPVSSGYLLLSALSRQLASTEVGEMIHVRDEGQFFTLSSLRPEYFWKTFRSTSHEGNLTFDKGDLFAFRVSLPNAEIFENFSSHVIGTQLALGGAGFKVLKNSQVGENDMSCWMESEELALIPPHRRVSVDFILPTGFKSNERQSTFPTPELFFTSLALRWQKWGKTSESFDQNVFSKVLVEKYSLFSAAVRLKNAQTFLGCVGSVRYSFEQLSETERAFLSGLASLAPFCGVGYKVTQGMGLVKVRF